MSRVTLSTVLLPLLLSAVCFHCTNGERSAGGLSIGRGLPCPKAGFFIAPDSCHEYYECRLFKGSLFPVLARCHSGTIFDDAISECRPKKFVTSPLRCVQDIAVAEGGSVDSVADDSSVGLVDDSSVDASVGDSYEDASVGDSSVDTGVVDSSVDASVGDSSVDTVVDDSSVDTIIDDSGVVANNTPAVIHVVEITEVIDQDSPPPTEGNVTGNDTGAFEDFVAVGQGATGTNDPLVNGTVIGNGADIVLVPDLSICDHIRFVERYVTLVMSNPSLKESFDHQTQYNENVMKYNTDLERAQNNTALWRRGDSILTGIKKTYQKASEYKSDFNRKLDINKRRIQDISQKENDQELYNSLVGDIENLREDIKRAKEALPSSDVPSVQQYFENLIASKQRIIERKQQEMKFASRNGRELGELLTFLESVRYDAKVVEDLARHWQEPVNYLHEYLQGDSLAFEKYASRTAEGILALTEEQEKLQVDLRANEDEQGRLENLKKSLNGKVDILSDKNWDIIQQRSRLLDVMEDKIKTFHRQAEELCKPGEIAKQYIPTRDEIESIFDFPQAEKEESILDKEESILDSIKSFFNSAVQNIKPDAILKGIAQACDRILKENDVALDLSEEREIMSQLSRESKENHKNITQLLGQLDGITQSMQGLSDASPDLKARLRQIDPELLSLQIHNTDLEDLQEGADTSIGSLLEIMEELHELQDSFEYLTIQFDDMMSRGNAAESDEDIRRERLTIERSISNLQSKVDQLVVPDIETCTFGL